MYVLMNAVVDGVVHVVAVFYVISLVLSCYREYTQHRMGIKAKNPDGSMEGK